jgi:hypothetical protein
VTQVEEHQLSKCEAVSSNPSTARHKKKKKGKKGKKLEKMACVGVGKLEGGGKQMTAIQVRLLTLIVSQIGQA